ncbi:cobaltochelatase subunit CobN [Anabaena cylindrica FACHB-243]|uniref:Cobaltochelatase CobN subunit n=1 Tax=Anabaena cylindrica (strain ATCC 27899 / PCC 7122) TaxID=272123 RepID=K9ZGK9_ANACC|nr:MULTISPECIES: cobaltochelatase subunit CobN [Anabaena]AFZ58316.1 cobaltochelatase CobN subunit [Anabaena cylindrica PCC 7122]MBD2416908.1 cobaltochelatase subunit CobN [Anabaena cylindrica FACHB-243]MBY5281919.1 cobaltochelatase subunit CobN [Anabaena sp. CCAP 1446/1C]MBY5310430.1 cobaltochelatase subunit CobN [Anabaena sp. CCAP 1446/1C]MCM2406440.1 cobaltochelatase subunit CobN [Anabaena sp. CCAP 1446/1C]
MHRISATSGGWNQSEGLIFLEQTPAPLVLITAADTDIQTLAAAVPNLPAQFPAFRVASLLQLQQQISIDTYGEQVLELAQVIVLRLLGGRSYWAYGLEVVQEIAQRQGTTLIVMPGDDALDPDLLSHSTVSLEIVNQIWQYFKEGGVENFVNALQFIADTSLSTGFNPPPPQSVPRVGVYGGRGAGEQGSRVAGENNNQLPITNYPLPKVGILFYRAHYLAGNTQVIDALCAALVKKNLQPVPVFVSSLREPGVSEQLKELFQPQDSEHIDLLLNTTSFSLARLETETPQIELWEKLDVPVLQVILCASSVEQWESQLQGLTPRDIAMNVALPEVDGRIISRAVSFKTLQTRNHDLETDVVVYEPKSDRIEFVVQLAANWVRLRQKLPQERRIALILANYPNTNGRLANGVGLDTPASCVEILKALQLAGYEVGNIPDTGDELIQLLTSGVTNDPEGKDWKPVQQSLSAEEYQKYFATLPESVQQEMIARWGAHTDENTDKQIDNSFSPAPLHSCTPAFPIPGIQFGNVFVGVQPSRGYDLDPSLNYHAPDLEPTHAYLAFYYWVREKNSSCFGADAIAHVGKHGNLEWLPGKSIALSNTCYPEVAFGAMPHLYPFIVNDPGEGSQAKRRAQAVIIDHLTPPMTRAELYGPLQQVENLIDEYYEAESLDPTRLPTIRDRIQELVIKENLYKDLGITDEKDIENFETLILNSLDGYLCELKEAQIRDGLHIFGQCPQGTQLRDLIIAIARLPNRHSIGITRAIAQEWGLDIDPLTDHFSTSFTPPTTHFAPLRLCVRLNSSHIIGDVVELLEEEAAFLVEEIIAVEESEVRSQESGEGRKNKITNYELPITQTLDWIKFKLLPALQKTNEEITNFLRGLDGKYIPSAASGAPTRGRPEVLPTGKNFYAVDIRAIPTETAWDIGRKAAETLIETYTQEHGEYPKTLGLSLWGTATMRTGGDDMAEALALLGVQPVWDGAARRVVDFEILPLSILGRPRVDVTLRISGFFRDAFPNLIDLFSQAVAAVAKLDEPAAENPLAVAVCEDTDLWTREGLSLEAAQERSLYRVFGSQPGAYGAGLQGLIASQNWQNDQDLARAYMNWSSYAYSGEQGTGSRGAREQGSRGENTNHQSPVPSPQSPVPNSEAFEQRLKQMQIVLHNQDNREHDLLDSDDYYQFQGGLTAAVRSLQGKNPETYFGDNSIPSQPKVRQLKTEIARVYRSRVVNPKWIAGVMRHGYKGAFEMAATVDFLFAYDATAQCVEDYMYQGVVQAYLEDPIVCEFIQDKNPWALRDISERLLEAHQRGLWQDANIQTLDNLRNLVHQAEAAIEEK